MGHTEAGGRGEERDVAGPQAVDRLFVGVDADEYAIVGHVDLLLKLFGQALAAGVDPIAEDVGHRPELEPSARDGEGVDRRTATPATAADERDTNLVTAGGMHRGRDIGGKDPAGRRGHGDGRGQLARRIQKSPPGHPAGGRIV